MQPDAATPARLLDAGRQVFAECGLAGARTRDICALARANVAAVNYHFGSKEQLYIQVLAEHVRQIRKRFPVDAGVTPDSPPEERLRAFVRGIMQQVLASGSETVENAQLGKLILLEMLQPSKHANVLIDELIVPLNKQLRQIIAELLPGAPDGLILRCTAGIMSYFVMFRFDPRVLDALSPDFVPKEEHLFREADAMVEFALGGINRLRTSYQA